MKDRTETQVKAGKVKTSSKSKSKIDHASVHGQSTILAFVGTKDVDAVSKQTSAPAPEDGDAGCTRICSAIISETEVGIDVNSSPEPETPIPATSTGRMPGGTSDENNEDAAGKCEDSISHQPQVYASTNFFIEKKLNSAQADGVETVAPEPARRSARLKSIQLKQSLKDENTSDSGDDDFQPRTSRSRVKPISKGNNKTSYLKVKL